MAENPFAVRRSFVGIVEGQARRVKPELWAEASLEILRRGYLPATVSPA